MDVTNVIALLSGVALFLFGMLLMGDGLKMVAGSKLEIILYRLTNTPLKGILLGTGVTAVIQSSSATSVMVVGFVNSGMMKISQAIGIVLGAILGTSITGWVICLSDIGGSSGIVALLSTETLTGVVAVIGIILRMFSKSPTKKHVGDILLGFAVLMFGMQAMSGAVAPLRQSEIFINILTTFSNPFLGILVGMLITCVIQSASAAVGILQALSITGAVTFSVALPITMGIAIGAAVPVLLSALGANANGKRTAFVYLLIDILGVFIWAPLFYGANALFDFSFLSMTMTTVSIALLNTVFRFATVVVLAPFVRVLEKIMCRLIKDDPEELADMAEIDLLEDRFIDHPALAIEQSRIVLTSMAKKAQNNLSRAIDLVTNFSDEAYNKIQAKENIIDKYEDKLGTYLVNLTKKELSTTQNRDISVFLHAIGDFERIGDHAVNIAEVAKEINEKKLEFSFDAKKELQTMSDAVSEIVDISVNAFEKHDIELAFRVEPLEELIDDLCDNAKMHHINRVQSGNCTLMQGFVYNDLITSYERTADHCSNIAVAMIEFESDVFDTHEYLNSLKKMKTASFNNYYDEYKAKYPL